MPILSEKAVQEIQEQIESEKRSLAEASGKLYTHWLYFDQGYMKDVRKVLSQGSNFEIVRFYNHPTDMIKTVIQIQSPDNYDDLDLVFDSGFSPLKYYRRKPKNLGKGLSVKQFTGIYGPLK